MIPEASTSWLVTQACFPALQAVLVESKWLLLSGGKLLPYNGILSLMFWATTLLNLCW